MDGDIQYLNKMRVNSVERRIIIAKGLNVISEHCFECNKPIVVEEDTDTNSWRLSIQH
jgi:hypothetical protein